MTIAGTLFSSTVTENRVTVGGITVAVSSASATQLVAAVDELPAGTHLVDVLVSGYGYATGTSSNRQYTVTLSVSSVSPSSGSVAGGSEVTVTGSGFNKYSVIANSVSLCNSTCDVSSATATSIVCTSGPLVNDDTRLAYGEINWERPLS